MKLNEIEKQAQKIKCKISKLFFFYRYPLTEIEFMSIRLPGNFEPEKAGKRMKLKTPETWETQLAK